MRATQYQKRKKTMSKKYLVGLAVALIFAIIVFLLTIFCKHYKNNRKIGPRIVPSSTEEILLGQETTPTITPPETETTLSQKKFFLKITSPQSGTTTNTSPVTIEGETIPYAEVFINDQELKADKSGLFTTTLTLEEDENYIIIAANDEWGNYAEQEISVIYQP